MGKDQAKYDGISLIKRTGKLIYRRTFYENSDGNNENSRES